MSDYRPLDLTSVFNVGTTFMPARSNPRIGSQSFHGLPFAIGADAARCYIGFESGTPQRVTLPVQDRAYHLIFAQTLLESQVMAGGPVGETVLHYSVQYASGETVRIPIRERFEVSEVPTTWGQWPFLAVPDQIDWLSPRYEGRWAGAGGRQTEANYHHSNDYYLWAWRNPHPEQMIEALTIEPGDRKILVAAITLGQVDEEPFFRQGRRPVKITLPEQADTPFSLDVEVDRGVATYPYPLPKQAEAEFLGDDLKGFGQTDNSGSSPAYVEIAAIPSATVTVKVNDAEVGQANWGELEAAGTADLPGGRLELVDRGRNWVHVTVVDDETGQPLPCRIHFRSPEGIPYQPDGHHNHIHSDLDTWHIDIGGDLRLGQATYAYIDGRCQGWLPRGDVIVDVARGYEYEPLRTRVHLEPGQRELTLRLKRWTNMNAQRWFSGDSHVHFLGAQGAHYEAQAEDLNVVNLLASQWGHLFTNTEDFTGGPSISNGGSTIIYASQENRQHILGHLTLWGLKQPVSPRGSSGPDEGALAGTLDVTMSNWADATHAQGGTVIIPHLPNPNGEPAALIATGRADAIEMLVHGDYAHIEYYRYLNAGYRLPLVGGTDKMSSDVPVGLYRTYAYIPPDEPFTYANWTKAVRAGRTFLSGGPMLTFTVNGAQVGDTIALPSGGGTLEVEATAESIFPIHTLQIVQQGRVVAATEETKGSRRLHLKAQVKIDGHNWLAARCGGPGYSARPHHDTWQRGIFAHTSPIYVAVGGDWWMFDRSAAEYMLTLIEGSLAHIHQRAAHYPAGQVTHHHGEDDHLGYLERPFREAIEAIHRRMHQLGIPH
ncbi:MAG: CehA/McbA family metallohydrolase [Anaerolineae bacterium]|nr:CehA/McbA family metallohydrolase [Anaerolineae bacterium]